MKTLTTKAKSKKVFKSTMDFIKKPIVIWPLLFSFLILFLMLNLIHLGGGHWKLSHIFTVLAHPSLPATSIKYIGFAAGEAHSISNALWAIFATMIGATGMALAGLITQSLTRNPLADASTLGMVQAAIFGVIVALSFGFVSYYVKFGFALLGGAIAAVLLFGIISLTKGKASVSKIVLAGLAIGIIFKTFSFLVRSGDKFLNSVSFNYVLGGAESVVKAIGKNQWLILYISAGLVGFSLILTAALSKQLTLMELGDEKAKNLGVKTKTTKTLSLLVLIVAVPASVIILGNVAFLGLFSVHAARYLMKSRNYTLILVPTILISMTMAFLGLYLSQFVPSINSGLWMTFIGAPYLIYAGIRGLR